MASLIKNQIIKRLSKFVKNLSSNQINLSTLKGEGELSSINLDEKALEDVIELPTWLKIQKATCGRAFIKIPWTNLKTTPIQLQLDDVTIEIETCEKLRDLNNPTTANDPSIGKYGFTNRVIDGISISITNITFAIKAQGFKASISLPTLDIYSTTPNGKRTDILTLTRLRSHTKDHILLFKEISWPNARIEASSNDKNLLGTAIRFIANSCRIRISMKKSLQDSSMVASRLIVELDDLLSVVNDAQLKSALDTYEEITQLMKRASEQRKYHAGNKLTKVERQQPQPPFSQTPLRPQQTIERPPDDPFVRYDIIETSFHFNIKRLDIHIIADSDVLTDRLVENGALQLTVANLSLDHYPYHEYGSSKKHWMKSSDMQSSDRDDWAARLHREWNEQLDAAKALVPNDDMSIKLEKALQTNRIRLFESCSVISIDDLVFYPVSMNNDKQQKRRRPLLTSDKSFYQLPDSLGIINIQHTEYYYPLPYSFPVPNSDLYIQIMPLVVRVDFATFTWLDAFVSTLSITIDKSGVLTKSEGSSTNPEHVAIKIDAMLPRVVINLDVSRNTNSTLNPEQIELNISKVLITNTRVDSVCNREKLDEHLGLIQKPNFFQQTQWPFSNTTSTRISPLFSKHSYDTYLYNNPLHPKGKGLPEPQSAKKALHSYYTMTTDSLKKSAKDDVWYLNAENIYLDFIPASVQLVKQNMIDTLTLKAWTILDEQEKNSSATVLVILESSSMLKISQTQYTFIMHLVDDLGLFLDSLERNKTETLAIKQKHSLNTDTNELKLTICLTVPTTFTLAVIDGLEDVPISSASSVSDGMIRDIPDTIDLVATPVKIDSPILNRSQPFVPPQKKENIPRGLESSSKGLRGSSAASLADMSDDTASLWDLSEDLDADLDASLFNNDLEQSQQKAVRIELDEDSISLKEKKNMRTTALESVNGVFVKLNGINVCITEDEQQTDKPMYIACNVKYLRLDEFSSMKFNTIRPKLFENQSPDELNKEDVPPIDIRVDIPKDKQSSPLPIVALQIQNRLFATNNRILDILSQKLEEILTDEQKQLRQSQPLKILPINAHLNNVQITLEFPNDIEMKPPMNVTIESLRVLRQIDGRVIIQKAKDTDRQQSNSDETLRQLELLRLENEQLRTEVSGQKSELQFLRGERESLMNMVSKLDVELTRSEYQQPRKN